MTTRVVGTAVVLLLAVAAGWALTWLARSLPAPGADAGVSGASELRGRLAMPLDAGLAIVELPSLRETRLVTPDRGAAVTSVTWSPTGDEIAYGYFHRKPGDAATSAEIFSIGVAGGEPRVLVERDAPGTQLDHPTWAPDGQRLYFSVLKQEGARFITRIEALDVASGTRLAVTDGYAPTISRDGRLLAFLRDSRLGQELWLAATDGSSARQLVMGTRFTAITSPRFSADGRSVAFAGALPAGTAMRASGGLVAALFSTPSVLAHGDPFDLWTVSVDGGEPTRFAALGDDEPSLSWSPDGRDLMVYAPGGLYYVDPRLGSSRKLSERGGYGGIDWAR